MNIKEARMVLWLENNQRPPGELHSVTEKELRQRRTLVRSIPDKAFRGELQEDFTKIIFQTH